MDSPAFIVGIRPPSDCTFKLVITVLIQAMSMMTAEDKAYIRNLAHQLFPYLLATVVGLILSKRITFFSNADIIHIYGII